MTAQNETSMSLQARVYIGCIVALGAGCIVFADWRMDRWGLFLSYLAICVLASALKIKLPGILGTMSVSFLFILIGVMELRAGQTIAMGCIGALVQCLWRPKNRIRPVQTLFSASNISLATFAAYYAYHAPLVSRFGSGTPILLMVSSLVYFLFNTAGIAGAIALTENKPLMATWRDCYCWSFPFYLVGASIAWVFDMLTSTGHAQAVLLLFPVIFLIYRSYRMYLTHLENEKKHVEQMAALHLRTIEALALAIDAKDHTTHDHLSRVRTYAVEIAKEMKIPEPELEALRAAALLHDIGKLAVPEHIISKPGKLTPEEFEKMKIHPVVGAEILERVEFPYPVVPIVRSHHEKWDGSGYPDGLRGEEIPIGARILSAVDCLDALASDRQYRRALPLDQAMNEVANLAGRSFDPNVVAILKNRYIDLERMAKTQAIDVKKLSTNLVVARGDAPDAGFEISQPSQAPRPSENIEFVSSIAAARQEVQLLFEMTQDMGSSLSLDETLSVVAARLKHMIPYDAIAVFVRREGKCVPEFVNGDSFRLLSSLQIPLGQGLSGWVAQTGRSILNGNPSVESGYLEDPTALTSLRSALAVPLVGLNEVVGVMTLYRREKDAFSSEHLRILLAISSKVSLSIDNALKFRQAETTATTDFLTGLPNARSLFLRLDSEVARAKRNKETLTVLVCDLDGFKQVNDNFGHLTGNKVLRAVGAALRDRCREYDYIARMGGDEFVLILPGMERRDIERRVRELGEIGGAAGRQVTGMDVMTISIGAAIYPEDGADPEQLLAEADRRMYRSKRNARATSGIAPAQPVPSPAPALATAN